MAGWALPVAMGISNIFGNLIGNRQQKKAAEEAGYQSRQHEFNMYNLQRRHALEDWDRVQAYNHPTQQMQRLREAGLSPHLVYGKGAHNTAAMVRSSQQGKTQQPVPRLDFSGLQQGAGQIMHGLQIQAQTDNIQAQADLNRIKAITEVKNQAKTQAETTKINRLIDYEIERMTAETQLKNAQRIYQLDENQRRELMNAKDLEWTTEKILREQQLRANDEREYERIGAAIRKLNADARISEINAFLFDEYGLAPGSPWYLKALVDLLSETKNTTPGNQYRPEMGGSVGESLWKRYQEWKRSRRKDK